MSNGCHGEDMTSSGRKDLTGLALYSPSKQVDQNFHGSSPQEEEKAAIDIMMCLKSKVMLWRGCQCGEKSEPRHKS